MRVWVHEILSAAVSIVGFVGGLLIGMPILLYALTWALAGRFRIPPTWLEAIAIGAGAYGGWFGANLLLTRIPLRCRCPQCGVAGASYKFYPWVKSVSRVKIAWGPRFGYCCPDCGWERFEKSS